MPPNRKTSAGPDFDKPVKLKATNRPEYGSDAMADTLRAIGFKYAFVNPGSSYRGLHVWGLHSEAHAMARGDRRPKPTVDLLPRQVAQRQHVRVECLVDVKIDPGTGLGRNA